MALGCCSQADSQCQVLLCSGDNYCAAAAVCALGHFEALSMKAGRWTAFAPGKTLDVRADRKDQQTTSSERTRRTIANMEAERRGYALFAPCAD